MKFRTARAASLVVAVLGACAPALLAGSVSGRVLDSAGRPIAGARVVWFRYLEEDEALVLETEGREPEPLGETRSDAAGDFRIALDEPNLEVAIRIQPAAAPEARLSGPYSGEETTALDDVRFPAAAKRKGRVVDEKGAGVGGARVAERGGGEDREAVFVASARTSADGSWEILAAPEDARVASVRAEGYVPSVRGIFRRDAAESVTLRRGGAIRGAVVDAAGKPVANALVVADDDAVRADASGRFRLAGVAAGERLIESRHGDLAGRAAAKVAAGGEAEVRVRLARAAALAGTVLEEGSRKPVRGARVAVSEGGGRAFGPRPEAARRARTDARGRFRAAGLLPGRYALEVAAEGFLPTELPGVPAALAGGAPLSVALRREASVSGLVLDEDGKPVAGARVAVPRAFNPRRGLRTALRAMRGRETVSGADGRFALRKLAPESSLTVEASKPGYAAGRKTGMRVKSGEAVRGVTLVLRRGLSAAGRVVDAAGKGIPDAEIRAARAERGGRRGMILRTMGGREKPDAVTDGTGAFVLGGLEEGRYQVAASKEGFAEKSPAAADVKRGAENRIAPIVLEAGALVAGVVRNRQGQPVAGAQVFAGRESGDEQAVTDGAGAFRLGGFAPGRPAFLVVTAEGYAARQANVTPPAPELAIELDTTGTVRGRVLDADSKAPLADFAVSRGEAPSGGGQAVMRLMVGEGTHAFHADDGAFSLEGVPPGRWVIRAEAPGYRTAEVGNVVVGSGEVAEGIVLSLKRGGVLSGRAVDASRGTGVANAQVVWAPAGSAPVGVTLFGPAVQREAVTDADGKFSFDALPDGKIVVTVTHPDYMDASLDVDPERQSTVEVSLTAGGAIAGMVVSSDGRTPAPGARVTLDEQGETGRFGTESAGTDGGGAFFFDHLRAGRYQLAAQTATGSSPPREVILADGQRADGVLLQTASGALLRGTVSGLPAGRLAGVQIVASTAGYSDGTTTDDAGTFTLPDAPPGIVRVSARANLRMAQTTVEVPDNTPEVGVDVVFQGDSRLAGRVTRGGKPLSGVFVNAADAGSRRGMSAAQTDSDGAYAIEGLEDGTYRVSATGEGVSYSKTFEVSGDTNGDIAVPGATLSGTVTDAATGMPVDGAEISAETGQETQSFAVKRTVADSNGAYAISDIDPGAYQATARKSGYRLKTQPANVTADGATLDFALTKGSGLPIRVADGQTGIPLSGVQALAFAGAGTIAFQGRIPLDGTGAGEVPSLADGRYSIYLFSDGYAPRSLPGIAVPSPEVPVAMTPGGRVEVRSDAPFAGRLLDAAGGLVLLSSWRLDGSVSASPPVTVWDHLAPGAYRLVASLPGGEKSFAFQVAEGQTTQLPIQ